MVCSVSWSCEPPDSMPRAVMRRVSAEVQTGAMPPGFDASATKPAIHASVPSRYQS
jgi:hypothetical protein